MFNNSPVYYFININRDFTQAPYWNNFGLNIYDNMTEFRIADSDPYVPGTMPHFVNYVEDIYVGYRYWETAAAEGLINYDSTALYPFGHGPSYTTFTQEMGPVSENNGTISFDVTVTNTGSVAGKDVVELYYTPPYTEGGIEKASVNLIAFDKTDLLQPGDSQTLTLLQNRGHGPRLRRQHRQDGQRDERLRLVRPRYEHPPQRPIRPQL